MENTQSPIPEFYHVGTDSWHRELYKTKDPIHGYFKNKQRIYGIVDGKMHYLTIKDGEPICQVEFNYTLKKES